MICPRHPAAPRFETLLPCRAPRDTLCTQGGEGRRGSLNTGKAVSGQEKGVKEDGVREGQLQPAGQGSWPLWSPPDPQGGHGLLQEPCRAQPDRAPRTCTMLSTRAVLSTGAAGLPRLVFLREEGDRLQLSPPPAYPALRLQKPAMDAGVGLGKAPTRKAGKLRGAGDGRGMSKSSALNACK